MKLGSLGAAAFSTLLFLQVAAAVEPECTPDGCRPIEENDDCTVDHYRCQLEEESGVPVDRNNCTTNPECCVTPESCNDREACVTVVPPSRIPIVNDNNDNLLSKVDTDIYHAQMEMTTGVYRAALRIREKLPIIIPRNLAQVVLLGMVASVREDPQVMDKENWGPAMTDMRYVSRCLQHTTGDACENAECSWCNFTDPKSFETTEPYMRDYIISENNKAFPNGGICYPSSDFDKARCSDYLSGYASAVFRHYMANNLDYPTPNEQLDCFARNWDGRACDGECALCMIPNAYGLKFSDNDTPVEEQPQRAPICYSKSLLFTTDRDAIVIDENSIGEVRLNYWANDLAKNPFIQQIVTTVMQPSGWCFQLQDISGNMEGVAEAYPWMADYNLYGHLQQA